MACWHAWQGLSVTLVGAVLQTDAQQLRHDNIELQHQVASIKQASPRPRSPLKQTPSQPSFTPGGSGHMKQSSSFFHLPQVSETVQAVMRHKPLYHCVCPPLTRLSRHAFIRVHTTTRYYGLARRTLVWLLSLAVYRLHEGPSPGALAQRRLLVLHLCSEELICMSKLPGCLKLGCDMMCITASLR